MPQLPITLPNNFDFDKPELWPLWKSRFERYIRIAYLDNKSEYDKIDILCYTMGIESEAILLQIIADPRHETLANVIQAFTDYFCPKQNLRVKRSLFRGRIQKPGESVDQFIEALCTLAEPCQYGSMTNDLIRDQILIGLSYRQILEQVQLRPHLSLEEIIARARRAEIEHSRREISHDSSPPADINCTTKQENYDKPEPEDDCSISKGTIRKPAEKKSLRHSNGGKEIRDLKICKSESIVHTQNKVDWISAEEDDEKRLTDNEQQMHDLAKEPHGRKTIVSSSLGAASERDSDVRAICQREDETERTWKLSRLKPSDSDEEDAKTEDLYRRVKSVLNKLTPQKFDTLVSQVRALQIDSQEKLQGVINLVFEKAVNEPRYLATYATMCKELAMMQVSGPDSNVNFRKLIIDRCQTEFEKNTVNENPIAIRKKEIEACADPEKKKELQASLTEEERRIRIKSVGNIRFIGELFKLQMLSMNIMHRCIRHLLTQIDDESLECLCTLLTIIGKDLESKNQNLDLYFKHMQDIVNRKIPGKLSPRVRFMLQDVIELRMNKWVPRRDDSYPTTMDQIHKEAETEYLAMHLNNIPKKDDRKGGRKRKHTEPERNDTDESESAPIPRGIEISAQQESNEKLMDDITVTKNTCTESVTNAVDKHAEKLAVQHVRKIVKEVLDNITPQNFNSLVSQICVLQIDSVKQLRAIARVVFQKIRDPSSMAMCALICKTLSTIEVSKSVIDPQRPKMGVDRIQFGNLIINRCRQCLSAKINANEKKIRKILTCTDPKKKEILISKRATREKKMRNNRYNIIRFIGELFRAKVIKGNAIIHDSIAYLLEQIEEESVECLHQLLCTAEERLRAEKTNLDTHFKRIANIINCDGPGEVSPRSRFMFIDLIKRWKYEWMLRKSDSLIQAMGANEMENQTEYGDWSTEASTSSQLVNNQPHYTADVSENKIQEEILESEQTTYDSDNDDSCDLTDHSGMEKIHNQFLAVMSNKEEASIENICSWISTNVGEKVSELEFIKVLMTTILEVSNEPYNDAWRFRVDKFHDHQALILRYIDSNIKLPELQCLIALQEYIRIFEEPLRIPLEDIEKQIFESIISFDVSYPSGDNTDITSLTRKSAALIALKSFFTPLNEVNEVDEASSYDEA